MLQIACGVLDSLWEPENVLDTFVNRILLCRVHHKMVDDWENELKAHALRRMVGGHEGRNAQGAGVFNIVAAKGGKTNWLCSIGEEMWTAEQVSVHGLLSEYAPGEMFLGSLDGIPVATMILQEEDALFWPSTSTGESLFLHKLSVRRAFAGTGMAAAMIQWAKREANRRSKTFLRLDCAADREKLCEFYEFHGFQKVREELMFGWWPTAFYEYVIL